MGFIMKMTSIKPLEIALQNIDIQDSFWLNYQKLVKDVVIPYQWDALNDNIEGAEPSHAIDNYAIAAGLQDGEFHGMVFQDSDVTKWLESAAYILAKNPDPALEKTIDDIVDLLAKVQDDNGYLNTYFTIKEPENRWKDLCECHELYCAGHLFEAAVAYYQATGKDKLLNISCKFADHIADTFGPEEGQIQGYPGHPEIELALMRLYEVTGNQRYSDLTDFFIEQRGKEQDPHFYDQEQAKRDGGFHYNDHGPSWMIKDKTYSQAHKHLSEQKEAIGHAVRFVYLLAGVAHLARLSKDQEKFNWCKDLWRNVIDKQMYITGAIGSQSRGEAFTTDYDLPNDTAYTETCASVGLLMFANRMLQIESDGEYGDIMERALYNTILAGMALDGKHFFYVNPLEVTPNVIHANHKYDHVKPVRQAWFGCSCCPTNVARTLASLGQYIFTIKDDVALVNLFISNQAKLELNQQPITLSIDANIPQSDKVSISVTDANQVNGSIAVRMPSWCANMSATLNGKAIDVKANSKQGYLYIANTWNSGDKIEVTLPMEAFFIQANPLLSVNFGKVAVQRGPFVYCIEQADNGEALHTIKVDAKSGLKEVEGEGLFAGSVLLKASGSKVVIQDAPKQALYHQYPYTPQEQTCDVTLIPYYAWANRGEGEMRVWINEK